MLEQLVAIVLVGLGLKTPALPQGNVMGERTENVREGVQRALGEVKRGRDEIRNDVREIQQDKKEIKRDLRLGKPQEALKDRQELKEDRIERREDIGDLTGDMKAELQNRLEEKREALKVHREDLTTVLKEKREEAKQAFEKSREEFKARLEGVKDEKKKQIVGRVDENMKKINEARTAAMTKHLEKMSEVLDKILVRAKEKNVDTTRVEAAVIAAQGAIESAGAAIAAQAGKEYVVLLTEQSKLRDDVKTTVNAAHSDLKAVHDQVAEAREKVRAAITALASLSGLGE